jgi:hypothetical protein
MQYAGASSILYHDMIRAEFWKFIWEVDLGYSMHFVFHFIVLITVHACTPMLVFFVAPWLEVKGLSITLSITLAASNSSRTFHSNNVCAYVREHGLTPAAMRCSEPCTFMGSMQQVKLAYK